MINYYETELREGLEKAAQYLTKADYYAQINAPYITQSFSRGHMKPEASSNSGRPRKYADTAPSLPKTTSPL